MERKIGEVFEYHGEWYQCLEQPKDYIGNVWKTCDFSGRGNCELDECSGTYRNDKKSVIFKKLEKIGGILGINGKTYQCIKPISHKGCTGCAFDRGCRHICSGQGIYVEIKQNKEDMKEKKLNLKPFDIQKAREGKPVYIRDGRKARILCYDFKQNEEYPILVAVENKDGKECALLYSNDGISEMYKSSNNELAMLPEKKEGWVNVYNSLGVITFSHNPYDTKEEALASEMKVPILNKYYVDTVKVEWEE